MSTTFKSVAKEIFVDSWKHLKFGIIPVKRVLEEDISVQESKDDVSDLQIDGWDDSNKFPQTESEKKYDVAVDESDEVQEYEYRDEANRPWWKRYLNEQEYRASKKKQKSNHWYSWFNGSPSAQEKKLIIKLDILVAFYACMSYWVKYLDRVNITNAYVSGMKESLGMGGNDLVHLQILASIGGVVSQLPLLFFLDKVPLNYLLPTLDFCWSCMTLGQGFSHSVGGIEALRFFVGIFEGPFYLSFQYSFGCFYKHDEIVRRSAFFYFGEYIGFLSSGGIQSAVYQGLNGRNGLEGWRWNFIIDSIISFIVAIIGFYLLPGDPRNCYSIFLTDDEIRLARQRLKENKTGGNDHDRKVFDLNVWKKLILDWKVYVFTVWNIFFWDNSNVATGCYILWLKSLTNSEGKPRYSITKVNQLSMITPGLGLVYLVIIALISDKFHSRWFAILFSQTFNMIGNVILAVWNVKEGAKWFAYMLQCTGWAMAPVLYSWVNDICRRDAGSRAIIMTIMNIGGSTFSVWTTDVFFPTVEAPRYLKGYSFTAANALALIIWSFLVLWLYQKEERKHAKENGIILYNSNVGIPPENMQLQEQEELEAKSFSSLNDVEEIHAYIPNNKEDKIKDISN